jgi:hypothetical protein
MPTATKPLTDFNYKNAAQAVLKTLKRDRDRQILAKRFGFGLARRQTLEQIGKTFNITRERVRQIEKAAIQKLQATKSAEVAKSEQRIIDILEQAGGLARVSTVAEMLGVPEIDKAYVLFLATLAGKIHVIAEDDMLRPTLALAKTFNPRSINDLRQRLVDAVSTIGQPATIKTIAAQMGDSIDLTALESLAGTSKELAHFEKNWGLISWPQVNPKSIRDKTYLVLGKHGKPLHFTEISDRIRNSNFRRRDVTVQAVHNELIKDPRFILIGRGIYALAEWGYTPGTVADIIIDVLRQESPLHKDEIVRRVLEKRQVRTTTIILNLQEKDHFERVAKATYKLKDK